MNRSEKRIAIKKHKKHIREQVLRPRKKNKLQENGQKAVKK